MFTLDVFYTEDGRKMRARFEHDSLIDAVNDFARYVEVVKADPTVGTDLVVLSKGELVLGRFDPTAPVPVL